MPFSAAHPSFSNNASSGTATLTQLHDLILAFPANNQPYDVDFCVQLRTLNRDRDELRGLPTPHWRLDAAERCAVWAFVSPY